MLGNKSKGVLKSISKIFPLRLKKSVYIFIYPNRKPKQKVLSEEETEKIRLEAIPRYKPTITNLLGKPLKVIDSVSFLFLYKEIFNLEIYKFNTNKGQPYIIDCGANIGLSIIYFKKLFPDAIIIGFEPDKIVFDALSYNINSFELSNVELINRGLWQKETTLKFYSEGADGGRLALESDYENIVEVKTIRLREFLNKPVDFLKIDIEGAEVEVIEDCEDLLYLVQNIFIEYHSFIGKTQTLDKLLRILSVTGFRYYISHIGVNSPHPFCFKVSYLNMDNQLNIYATRNEAS